MKINKGDVLQDCIYLGEGYADHCSYGIVLYVDKRKVVVNWIEGHLPWGVPQKDIEEFDLSKEGELETLLNMKKEYLLNNPEEQ